MSCFPIGARQGALKVTPHGASRSVGQAMIDKNESRRDDSVVQNVVSTKEASLREGGKSLSIIGLETRSECNCLSDISLCVPKGRLYKLAIPL